MQSESRQSPFVRDNNPLRMPRVRNQISVPKERWKSLLSFLRINRNSAKLADDKRFAPNAKHFWQEITSLEQSPMCSVVTLSTLL